LQNTGKTTTENKQVVGVPKQQANLLVEYRMPFINGLTPYLNLHYTGKQAANDTNTSWASSYKTIDIGARYNVKIMGVDTTWRLAVNNLTNEEYWASIMPGSINGTGGSCTAWLGTPREINASVGINF
jgi:iron complex outermembrane receptor protein